MHGSCGIRLWATSNLPAVTSSAVFGSSIKSSRTNRAIFKLKHELAVFLGNFANLCLIAKDKTKARRAYLQALEIQKDLVQHDPANVEYKNDLALTYHNFAFLAASEQEKRALLEQALGLRKQLAEALPGNPVFRRHLARTYESLGATSSLSVRPRMVSTPCAGPGSPPSGCDRAAQYHDLSGQSRRRVWIPRI